jgi:hypothetical protein
MSPSGQRVEAGRKTKCFSVWLDFHPQYNLLVTKPASAKWPWLPGWGEDEGAGTTCATSKITVRHARVSRTLGHAAHICAMTDVQPVTTALITGDTQCNRAEGALGNRNTTTMSRAFGQCEENNDNVNQT